eukprot:Sspe_Gene.55848::Locus_30712_Transcript_1_1_Confidence_1.000_Length_1641::g.55848::m.55848
MRDVSRHGFTLEVTTDAEDDETFAVVESVPTTPRGSAVGEPRRVEWGGTEVHEAQDSGTCAYDPAREPVRSAIATRRFCTKELEPVGEFGWSGMPTPLRMMGSISALFIQADQSLSTTPAPRTTQRERPAKAPPRIQNAAWKSLLEEVEVELESAFDVSTPLTPPKESLASWTTVVLAEEVFRVQLVEEDARIWLAAAESHQRTLLFHQLEDALAAAPCHVPPAPVATPSSPLSLSPSQRPALPPLTSPKPPLHLEPRIVKAYEDINRMNQVTPEEVPERRRGSIVVGELVRLMSQEQLGAKVLFSNLGAETNIVTCDVWLQWFGVITAREQDPEAVLEWIEDQIQKRRNPLPDIKQMIQLGKSLDSLVAKEASDRVQIIEASQSKAIALAEWVERGLIYEQRYVARKSLRAMRSQKKTVDELPRKRIVPLLRHEKAERRLVIREYDEESESIERQMAFARERLDSRLMITKVLEQQKQRHGNQSPLRKPARSCFAGHGAAWQDYFPLDEGEVLSLKKSRGKDEDRKQRGGS